MRWARAVSGPRAPHGLEPPACNRSRSRPRRATCISSTTERPSDAASFHEHVMEPLRRSRDDLHRIVDGHRARPSASRQLTREGRAQSIKLIDSMSRTYGPIMVAAGWPSGAVDTGVRRTKAHALARSLRHGMDGCPSSKWIVCHDVAVATADVLTEILRLPAEERARLCSRASPQSRWRAGRGCELGVGCRARTSRCRGRCRHRRDVYAR